MSVNPTRPKSSTNTRTSKVNPTRVSIKGNAVGSNASNPNSQLPSTLEGKRQIVGQYMLGKTIGEGTFGKVKLAAHMPSGEKVAIKILEKSRIKESADVRRVNREIKILKKARHANVIQLYEVLDTPNAIYLIMECCDGGEMFDFIVSQKHVAEPQACKFFHQIVDGVDCLHKNEITHRDLKPENLLLKASPEGWIVKVVDFGLSNTHDGGRLLSTACGSPCYAAPEMIAGKKYIGPLADIWSMGVILFALVCGFLPFEDPNTAVLYKKILSGEYKTPKWISPEVKDLIRNILEVDPRKRYTMDDIRKHPWYTMVPDSEIPHEIIDEQEDAKSRAATLSLLSNAGVDMQELMDGLASHACNSLTALYYLFEQKQRTNKVKNGSNQQSAGNMPTSKSDPTATSTVSKTSSIKNETNKAEGSSKNPVVKVDAQKVEAPAQPPSPVQVKPSPLFANNPVPGVQPASQPEKQAIEDQSGNPIISPRPTGSSRLTAPAQVNPNPNAPYLQAPQIIQQHQKQVSANQPNTLPSLDVYMKTGLGLPPQGNGNNNNDKARLFIQNKPSGNNAGSIDIPKLNLKNKIVPPLQNIPAASSDDRQPAHLSSQTSRPGESNIAPMVHPAPQSARAILSRDSKKNEPEVIPSIGSASGEGNDRPNTRRSRARTRGTDQGEILEDGPAEGPLESFESQKQQPQQANVPQRPSMQPSSHISNPLPVNNQSEPQPIQVRAPDGQKSSISSSGVGRRGKNLVNSSTNNETPTETKPSQGIHPIAPMAPSNPRPNLQVPANLTVIQKNGEPTSAKQ